jgi:prephenate dehydrogenase
MNQKENTVAIFGGSGNMGQLAAGFFQKSGYKIIISDPKAKNSISPEDTITQADILYFSIYPTSTTITILESLKNKLQPNHCILDNASVKQGLEGIYTQLDNKGVSVCSTHPLIKHDQPPYGQKTLIMPFGKNSKKATTIAERIHQDNGMKTITIPFAEHDDLMATAQLIPHLIMRAIWHTMQKNSISLENLISLAPANLQLFLLSMFRTVIQDPKISSSIIKNLLKQEKGKQLSESFKHTIQDFISTIDENQLTELFASEFDLSQQKKFKDIMNESTTVALERLNNLNARSIIIEVDHDKPGLLRKILLPFEQNNISLTAIDSHKTIDKLKFEIGLDPQTYTPESVKKTAAQLKALGYKVSLSND